MYTMVNGVTDSSVFSKSSPKYNKLLIILYYNSIKIK